VIFAFYMLKALLFFVVSFSSMVTLAQSHRVPVKDLREDWKIPADHDWVAPSPQAVYQTIYFSIDPTKSQGKYLEVTAVEPFSIWYADKLLGSYQQAAIFSLDSLMRIHRTLPQFKVHARGGLRFVKTHLVKYAPTAPVEELRLREKPYFLNFCILVVLLLAVYFVLLFQSNPRLIIDYFNFSKLLSIQERDETLATGRITSSINLMVYAFIGLCFSFVLIVILHFTRKYFVVSNEFSFSSVSEGMATWLKLSFFIVAALLVKMAIVSLATRLFKFREGYAIQVLNFFRHLAFVLVLFSMTIVIYFIAKVEEPIYYKYLVLVFGWMLMGWVVLIFLKLLSKSPFSGFHLFSYLWATEIFPLVIFFEILFF
jgi:Domain of unknown function (DUF4271)